MYPQHLLCTDAGNTSAYVLNCTTIVNIITPLIHCTAVYDDCKFVERVKKEIIVNSITSCLIQLNSVMMFQLSNQDCVVGLFVIGCDCFVEDVLIYQNMLCFAFQKMNFDQNLINLLFFFLTILSNLYQNKIFFYTTLLRGSLLSTEMPATQRL